MTMRYRDCSHHIIISCSPIVVYQSENMKNIDNGQSNCMSICVMEWCRETWIAVLLCTDTILYACPIYPENSGCPTRVVQNAKLSCLLFQWWKVQIIRFRNVTWNVENVDIEG